MQRKIIYISCPLSAGIGKFRNKDINALTFQDTKGYLCKFLFKSKAGEAKEVLGVYHLSIYYQLLSGLDILSN